MRGYLLFSSTPYDESDRPSALEMTVSIGASGVLLSAAVGAAKARSTEEAAAKKRIALAASMLQGAGRYGIKRVLPSNKLSVPVLLACVVQSSLSKRES